MAATVTVRGTARANAQPDEVAIDLSVDYLDRTAEAALAEVARRATELEKILTELGIERNRWTTTGATVHEETEWNDKTRQHVHRGYRAENRVHLRLADPQPLGALMSAAVARANAEISGPSWSVAEDNPARLEACRAAALNAQSRAEAYVAALGARLGAIVSIAEPGTSFEPIHRDASFAQPKLMAIASAAPEIEIHAGEMEVRATVLVTYSVEQG